MGEKNPLNDLNKVLGNDHLIDDGWKKYETGIHDGKFFVVAYNEKLTGGGFEKAFTNESAAKKFADTLAEKRKAEIITAEEFWGENK